ncbi:hypothetical protein F5884DRAFT_439238 [Xylogone sp. PMI_703]|nr:hypothetical protein F5884DRAFT_439238 [Xylogone sp. PMI_703]
MTTHQNMGDNESLLQRDHTPSSPTVIASPEQTLFPAAKKPPYDSEGPTPLEFSNLAAIQEPIPWPFRPKDELHHEAEGTGAPDGNLEPSSPNNLNFNKRTSFPRVPVGSRASWTPPSPSTSFRSAASGAAVSPISMRSPTTPKLPRSPPSSNSRSLLPDWNMHGLHGYSELHNVEHRIDEVDEQEEAPKPTTSHQTEEGLGISNVHEQDQQMRNDEPPALSPGVDSDMGSPGQSNSSLSRGCPSHRDIYYGRNTWLSTSIIMLSVYSTVASGIWLFIAILQPRYGRTIHSSGSITPSGASTLFALIAKTIEVSFVTVFVTFLGQVLSRRSLVRASRGITIAEMSMKTWVIQPGFMITHWENLLHAGLTFLGVIAFLTALVAMFYTTASDALVAPHLRFGNWDDKVLEGWIQSSYANPNFVQSSCETPVSSSIDFASGETCLALEHAGEAYHNYLAYMRIWAEINRSGEGVSSNLSERPQATAMISDNTTVAGSWVSTDTSNMTLAFKQQNRVINNVTMSMPHAGVFEAAHDEKNGILQPAELAGVGEYMLRASVVSPTVNVLCINMDQDELAPLIYTTWPHAKTIDGPIPGQKVAWSGWKDDVQVSDEGSLNSTVVDDLFEWGPKYQRQPPVFPMYPIDYNSIANISVPASDSVYILFKTPTPAYSLCQLRSYLSPHCSTQYNVSGTAGGHLESHCEDPKDHMAYSRSVSDAPIIWNTDWRNVEQEWTLALSFNDGISNANASVVRFLTEMVPVVPDWGEVKLNPLLPSVAEALAVLSGCTLLLGSTGASFYHYWEYSSTILSPGTYQPFNASLSSQQYASGPTQPWQDIFYIVLALVFLTNIFCLGYFLIRGGLVTDFTETQNLFGLAVNSPPSDRLRGSCGGGPHREQLDVDWHVTMEDSGHYYLADSAGEKREVAGDTGGGMAWRAGHEASGLLPRMDTFNRLSSKRRSWL